MSYGLIVTVEPTVEPLLASDLPTHLNTSDNEDAGYIDLLIKAARIDGERELSRAFITQTLAMKLNSFPNGCCIQLPRPPLQSVTSIVYLDTAGASQTMSSADYDVDTSREPGQIVLAPNVSWPSTEAGRVNAVTITYVAGYGLAVAVPENIKQAMRLMVADSYENRGDGAMQVHKSNTAIHLMNRSNWGDTG